LLNPNAMPKYIFKHNNSITFTRYESSSGYAGNNIGFQTDETVFIETEGDTLEKEHISAETVEAFFKFFNEHKEALRNLT